MTHQLSAVPPHDIALERALLGAVAQAGQKADHLFGTVHAADFYATDHQTMWATMAELRSGGRRIDLVLLGAKLAERVTDRASLVNAVFETKYQTENIEQYAEEVCALSRLRASLLACQAYQDEIARDVDPARAMASLRSRLDGVAAQDTSQESTEDAYEDELRLMGEEMDAAARNRGVCGVPTGYPGIDNLLGGWQQGVNFLAGWTHSGKTALLLHGLAPAAAAGKRWRFYCVDMRPRKLWMRMLQQKYGIGRGRAKRGELTDDEKARLYALPTKFLESGCTFVRSRDTLDGICADARRWRGTFEWLIIDTWQSLTWRDSRSPYERVCDGVVQVKALANELNIPVVCTMQAKDPPTEQEIAKGRASPPGINDLEGGRRLSQEASVIVAVHREDYGIPDSDVKPQKATVRVLKDQSGGCTGSVPMVWFPDFGKFEEAPRV